MNFLIEQDIKLLLYINQNLESDFLTLFFQNITDLHKNIFFLALVLASLVLIIIKLKKRGGFIVASLFITLAASDLISYRILKNNVERLRPAVAGIAVEVRTPAAGTLSFTSNHAANIFALALFISFFIPQARIPLFILAFLVSLSRVYLGVHYPLDVICGAGVGTLAAFLGIRVFKFLERKYLWQKS